jgi:uncharacterized membrane protein YhaH (DUF805 family)
VIYVVVIAALVLPYVAATVRRLHDTGRSGWWYLLNVVPLIGPVVLLVWTVSDSHPDNEYGPNPKGAVGAPPAHPSLPNW